MLPFSIPLKQKSKVFSSPQLIVGITRIPLFVKYAPTHLLRKVFAHFNSCYDFDLSDVSNKDLGKEKASEHSCSEVLADYINLSSHGSIYFANLHLKDLTERYYGFNCIINP